MKRYAVAAVVFAAVCAAGWTQAGGLPPSKSARLRTQLVSIEQLQSAIRAYLKGELNGKVADIQVDVVVPQKPTAVPAGLLDIRVTPGDAGERYGRRNVTVVLSVDGKSVETLRAVADVTAMADVVTATRLIKAEETIGTEDLTVARLDVSDWTQDYFVNVDDVAGKRAIRAIRPHAPIAAAQLGQPYLVRKGDRVTIEARRGGLVIQTTGTTRASGQFGQSLAVTNQESGKEIKARVTGPGLVQVEF